MDCTIAHSKGKGKLSRRSLQLHGDSKAAEAAANGRAAWARCSGCACEVCGLGCASASSSCQMAYFRDVDELTLSFWIRDREKHARSFRQAGDAEQDAAVGDSPARCGSEAQ